MKNEKEKIKMMYWEEIVNLMNDEIREQIAYELGPCTEEEFLARYLELDPEFQATLDQMGI